MKRHIKNLFNVVRPETGKEKLQRNFYAQDSITLAKSLLGKVIVRCLPTGQILRGTIVETEAYPGTEEALALNAHCFITKKTEKNAGIFMEAGTTWVYMTYGVFNMINISAKLPGSACLIRAIEPKQTEGQLQTMENFRLQKKPKKVAQSSSSSSTSRTTRSSRGKTQEKAQDSVPVTISTESDDTTLNTTESTEYKPKFKLYELGNGPGKLCKVLNIEKSTCDQLDLTTSPSLWIEDNDEEKFKDGNFEIVEATRIGINSAPQSSQNDLFRFYIADNLCVSTVKPSQIRKNLVKKPTDEDEGQ